MNINSIHSIIPGLGKYLALALLAVIKPFSHLWIYVIMWVGSTTWLLGHGNVKCKLQKWKQPSTRSFILTPNQYRISLGFPQEQVEERIPKILKMELRWGPGKQHWEKKSKVWGKRLCKKAQISTSLARL